MMEPFGLLSFLQSMLTQPPQNTENKENTVAPNADAAPDHSLSENMDTTPQTSAENEKKQDAILAFLTAHERHAGRIKK